MDPNEGQRHSRFHLDRYLTGELSADDAAAVATHLTEADEAHFDAVRQARAQLPPFDAHQIRSRAQRPANNTAWYRAVGAVAALAALVLIGLRLSQPAPADNWVQFRGAGLYVYTVANGEPVPYGGEPLGEGDTLAFQVTPRDHEGVVLLSIDGTGTLTVFFPAEGDAPVPLPPNGPRTPLPTTVVLDGAPGPEVFVAVFDHSVAEAEAYAAERYREGGADGLLAWADERDDVDAVEVERR